MLNVIVLWNTLYINAAVEQLRAEGFPVRREDVARLSPLVFEHIICWAGMPFQCLRPFNAVNCGRSGAQQNHWKTLPERLSEFSVPLLPNTLVLDRPVLDRTKFDRPFDLNLSFTADEATMGMPGFGGPGDPSPRVSKIPTDPDRPTIFAALQEQLGLKLVSAEGPVEVLVIDRAERPTPN